MISILFNWIYIFITTFMTGFLFTRFVTQKLHYKILHISNILLCGIIIATVYAQLFSLFVCCWNLCGLIKAHCRADTAADPKTRIPAYKKETLERNHILFPFGICYSSSLDDPDCYHFRISTVPLPGTGCAACRLENIFRAGGGRCCRDKNMGTWSQKCSAG